MRLKRCAGFVATVHRVIESSPVSSLAVVIHETKFHCFLSFIVCCLMYLSLLSREYGLFRCVFATELRTALVLMSQFLYAKNEHP